MNTTYKNKKGFTLIEILLVAAVITILAGVAFYNIHVSIADFKERAEMLSIRNGSYGFFEPGAQFETEQRLNFRNYISEMRSLTGDPSVGVLPENADAEGSNPAEGGSSVVSNSESSTAASSSVSTSATESTSGGGGGETEPTSGGGGAAYSDRIHINSTTGNSVSFSLSDGGGNNINLTITRNGSNYVMTGCDSGMQWILEGHGGAPAMPGYGWHNASYTLNDSQIAWLNNNYGIDVTTIGGGGGGGSSETSAATESSSGGGSGGAVTWGATVSGGGGGNGSGTQGVISASTSGNVTTFYMTQNNGWNAENVTITDNGNGTYTINLGSRGMSDSFMNDHCPDMNWGDISFVLTNGQINYLRTHYGIEVPTN